MPVYQVTTKLLGTILVEAEMQGDVYETINKDQITSLVTYLHKEDTIKKKITLESELAELLRTNRILLWKDDSSSSFYGECKGIIYSDRTVSSVLNKILKKSITQTPENLEISKLIHHQLKKSPFNTTIELSMENDCFKVTSQGVKTASTTLKGALVNLRSVLVKQGK